MLLGSGWGMRGCWYDALLGVVWEEVKLVLDSCILVTEFLNVLASVNRTMSQSMCFPDVQDNFKNHHCFP